MWLFCVLVGTRGSPFVIDIDACLPVSRLKIIVVATKMSLIQRDPDELLLYYANIRDGWLREDDPLIKAVLEGTVPDEIRSLLTDTIHTLATIDATFAGEFTAQAIHVLVADPRPRARK